MNGIESKGRSPFFPDQPVPVELFEGRASQIEHIMTQGVGQVVEGKPVTIFLEGEYGIGKTSIAKFSQWIAERDKGLLGIYASLDRAEKADDIGAAVLEATLHSGVYDPKLGEKIRNGMAKFIGQQSLLGLSLNFEELKTEGPKVARGLLPFLKETLDRVKADGPKGIFLVLDEINGIVKDPAFAHFLKGIVDSNAAISLEKPSLPLLIMLCGVKERRMQLISNHEPVGRIFDVVQIEKMADGEMEKFFIKAFNSVHIDVKPRALKILKDHSAGFPKIMHLIGNAAFWQDRDGVIDKHDAYDAVIHAAEEVGKRYVDQQIYAALLSEDYRSILDKIAKMGPESMSFRKQDVAKDLTDTEKRKFNNFLQKMKRLGVLRSGDAQGEYIFIVRMVRLYIWLRSLEDKK